MFLPVRFCRVSVALSFIYKKTHSYISPSATVMDINWDDPQPLTSGGGSPPAPAGQSGSIFFLPWQLQTQAGDGSSMVQLSELNSCWTLTGTSGTSQSSSPIVHVASLWRTVRVLGDPVGAVTHWYHHPVSYWIGCPTMQRAPKPGGSRRAFCKLCIVASPGASLLTGKNKNVTH